MKRVKYLIFAAIFLIFLLAFNVLADMELLVKTSDSVLSASPREAWTDAMFEEERRGNSKQGYILAVRPAGFNWGNLERDPKRAAIITIPDEVWNPEWLEPEYDYSKPDYDLDGNLVGYEILTERRYRLPLETFIGQTELSTLKSIPCDDTAIRPAIEVRLDNIADLVIVNDWLTGPWDWVRPGDPSCEHYASLGRWYVEGTSLIGYPRYARDRTKFLLLEEPVTLISNEIRLEIPTNTLIRSENLFWDGTITLPTLKESPSVSPDGGAELGTVFEIGFANVKLTTDRASRITIPGQARNRVGYTRGESFTEITTECTANTQEFADTLPDEGDCKIDEGSDLIVWTKHFTEFVTFSYDTDGDGISDSMDNCPDMTNQDQADCNNNGIGDACDEINPDAEDSDCNGVDDNCNGITDDEYLTSPTSCGIGACTATGQLLCQQGNIVNTCTPGDPLKEVCDNLDNDCDSLIDEDLNIIFGSDVGECSKGIKTCQDGEWLVTTPRVGPSAEVCDSLDNDCDGKIDEDPETSSSCDDGLWCNGIETCQQGSCIAETLPDCTRLDDQCNKGICDESTDSCIIQPKPDETECNDGLFCTVSDMCSNGICLGQERDCSDDIACTLDSCDETEDRVTHLPEHSFCDDENICTHDACSLEFGCINEPLTSGELTCGLGLCKHTIKECLNGILQECDPFKGARKETCDSLDNDCDGKIDEDFSELGQTCTTGIGQCQVTGVYVCSMDGIGTECNAIPRLPREEICDAIDNDCDGKIDEEHVCEAKFIRGDANQDGIIDIGDVVYILNYLFSGYPSTCDDSLDSNDDGWLDIGDAVYILNYLFRHGPEPKEPFPDAGIDPTFDELGCGGGG